MLTPSPFSLCGDASFDYGEFRTVAELATSSATYDTFGFVFENAGTYVFSSSCNPGSVIVLAVMGEDVRLAAQHTLFATPST